MGVVTPLVGFGHLSDRTEVIEDEEHKTLSASDEDADFSTWTLEITGDPCAWLIIH